MRAATSFLIPPVEHRLTLLGGGHPTLLTPGGEPATPPGR